MTNPNDDLYEINFFKSSSAIARENSRVIILFISIWALAVFGFQFLLMATNKMTPEETLVQFQEVWPKIQSDEATAEDQTLLSKTLLKVLGKNIALAEADKSVLKQSLSLTLAKMAPGQTIDVSSAAEILKLESEGYDQLMIELLPYSLVEVEVAEYPEGLPAVMELYCTHPRGPLTDFTFLGFPFHYWYTAQFLLILFVLLCLFYAVKIEKIYKKHDFVEEQH
ncbi:MAG: DUF4212 domain-containing protein [Opitutales bacterium]|nr:DUF4212 domain-containing protein [Opitutales bacterium]